MRNDQPSGVQAVFSVLYCPFLVSSCMNCWHSPPFPLFVSFVAFVLSSVWPPSNWCRHFSYSWWPCCQTALHGQAIASHGIITETGRNVSAWLMLNCECLSLPVSSSLRSFNVILFACALDQCVDTERQNEVVARNGIRALVRAMAAHHASSKLQWQGCVALSNAMVSGALNLTSCPLLDYTHSLPSFCTVEQYQRSKYRS